MKYFRLILLLYFATQCYSQISDEYYGYVDGNPKKPKPPGTHEISKPIGRQVLETMIPNMPTTKQAPPSQAAPPPPASSSSKESESESENKPKRTTSAPSAHTPYDPNAHTPSSKNSDPESGSAETGGTTDTEGTTTMRADHVEFTEFDINKHLNSSGNLTEQEMQDLTAAAFAALSNRSSGGDDESGVYNENEQWWEFYQQRLYFGMEWMAGIWHVGTHDQRVKSCYFIGVTYKEAIKDIRDYYKLRYLYHNNLDYEVGFLVQEIIFHYQIAVELYHLMMRKYGSNRYRYYAPTTYMLYMYTNILFQCKTILHLCNMLHELESKYKKHPDTIFQDYHIQKDLINVPPFEKDRIKALNDRLYLERKRREREHKKLRKKLFKDGFYVSTTRTRRPRKGPFPLHYGWSIEDW